MVIVLRGAWNVSRGHAPVNPRNIYIYISKMCLVMQKEMLAGENRDKYYKKVFNNIQEQTQLRDVSVWTFLIEILRAKLWMIRG